MLSTGNFFLSDNSMKHTHNENVFLFGENGEQKET